MKIPTKAELKIMHLIAGEPLYGLEVAGRSNGAVPTGSVYTLLRRLKDKGLVGSKDDRDPNHHGMRRPRYSLTREGKRWVNFIGAQHE